MLQGVLQAFCCPVCLFALSVYVLLSLSQAALAVTVKCGLALVLLV